MVEYQIYAKIESSNNTEMLNDLTWLKDNYGAKINAANASSRGSEKKTTISLTEATFNEAITALNALLGQFTGRIDDYGFQVK